MSSHAASLRFLSGGEEFGADAGLLKVQSGLLRAPFERDLNVPGECFCSKTGRLPAFHNGLNDVRRQEGQTDHATYWAGKLRET